MDKRILEFDFEKYVSNLLSDEAKKQISDSTRIILGKGTLKNAPPTENDQKIIIKKRDEFYNQYIQKAQDVAFLHSTLNELQDILDESHNRNLLNFVLDGNYVGLHSTVGKLWGLIMVVNEIQSKLKNTQFDRRMCSELLMELFYRAKLDPFNHNDLKLATLFNGITGLSLTNHRGDIAKIRRRKVNKERDELYAEACKLLDEQIMPEPNQYYRKK